MKSRHILRTGLERCHDATGAEIPCDQGTAIVQDAAMETGAPWPTPRFTPEGDGLIRDLLTGLVWSLDANPLGFPCTWSEALAEIQRMNESGHLGRRDWRLPNRCELRSLVGHGSRKPALPPNHPFENVFLGWYWSSTTSAKATAYAWYVHFEGGRMFYGAKTGYCLAWPVCGESAVLPRTGQSRCWDEKGVEVECAEAAFAEASLEDGALQRGAPWPEPRFQLLEGDGVLDRLTRLVWQRNADAGGLLTWEHALETALEARKPGGLSWRLPNINELESLVDCSRHDPALPEGHPFENVRQAYWSSTTSFFETDWSFCLYLDKGAVGVGHKPKPEFHAWLVADAPDEVDGVDGVE